MVNHTWTGVIDFGGEVITRSGPEREPNSLVIERAHLKSTINKTAKWDRSSTVIHETV